MSVISDFDFINTNFEILLEEEEEIDIQAMEEFKFGKIEAAETYKTRSKINEIIKALKQLDKK